MILINIFMKWGFNANVYNWPPASSLVPRKMEPLRVKNLNITSEKLCTPANPLSHIEIGNFIKIAPDSVRN